MDLYSNSLDSVLRIDGFMLDGVLLSKLDINKYIEQRIFVAELILVSTILKYQYCIL